MPERLLEDLGAFARLRRTLTAESHSGSDPANDGPEAGLMRPLDPARAAEILERVARATTPATDAVVLPHRRSRPTMIALTVVAMTAVAAAFLLVDRDALEQRTPAMYGAQTYDLSYELAYLDAPGTSRGADDTVTFSAGDTVALRLRPQRDVAEAVTAEIRAVQGTHELPLAWRVDATSDRGHLEVRGDADDLLAVSDGAWTLHIRVLDARSRAPRWSGSAELRLNPGVRQRR